MRVYRITLLYDNKPQGSYIEKHIVQCLDGLRDELLFELSINDGYKIEVLEMSENEYDSLPEFNGF